jgi:hypothetical protein
MLGVDELFSQVGVCFEPTGSMLDDFCCAGLMQLVYHEWLRAVRYDDGAFTVQVLRRAHGSEACVSAG